MALVARYFPLVESNICGVRGGGGKKRGMRGSSNYSPRGELMNSSQFGHFRLRETQLFLPVAIYACWHIPGKRWSGRSSMGGHVTSPDNKPGTPLALDIGQCGMCDSSGIDDAWNSPRSQVVYVSVFIASRICQGLDIGGFSHGSFRAFAV